ncbi:hypothetical protein EVAR_86142_1 [Eumeta japonica]|uniref:Uncharacterized protein n=1 Tax=Eumeta variegata TaxID=151549 RepID=A0A4C1V1C1_EUMVA|nr:hypothetical protein EVAR_86142_1 [Eumeta japonica]
MGQRARAPLAHFLTVSPLPSNKYPILTQETDNSLVTPPALQMFMGDGDHLRSFNFWQTCYSETMARLAVNYHGLADEAKARGYDVESQLAKWF